ncbi:energy transducer TonB [Methylosinus sp. Sm6]|nr:energy transducer TonB [Methylosinus sp. Sm6]
MKRITLALLCGLPFLCGAAAAVEGKAGETKPAAAPPAAFSGLSQSKFLGLLYSEIAKRTPMNNTSGPGSATANFHIDAAGRVDKVTIARSSSAKHAELVRKILTGLQAPPPPAGSFEGSQTFNFH